MLNKIIETTNKGTKVVIEIEASASKVPTKTFVSNEELAKFRSEEAKQTIITTLTEKGIGTDKYSFKKAKNLVQGPNYKGDAENTETYEKYQYVIINVK